MRSEKIRRSAAAAVVVDHLIKSLQLINYTNVIIWLLCFCFYMPFSVNGSKCRRNPVIFNFGDSNSDNGELAAGVGYTLAPQEGITFFLKPSGRLCDGRLVIDFLCESLNISGYLTPYMESMAPDFRNGANFGSDGGSLFPRSPFNLVVQVFQFLRFRTRSLELYSQGVEDMLGEEEFNKALYIFDIGQNDLVAALDTLSFDQALKRIPSLISEIEVAMWRIYNGGGRNIWVHNIGPLGCWPQRLGSNNATDYDKHGCFQYLNKGAKEFNSQLNARCEQLRIQMKNAMIVYVDLYAIKYDLIANAAFYGFENPLMACCGNGGPPYNFNPKILCGQKGSKVCKNVSRYISWDGVHYTDAANAFVTSKILSTKYSRPPIKFDFFCN